MQERGFVLSKKRHTLPVEEMERLEALRRQHSRLQVRYIYANGRRYAVYDANKIVDHADIARPGWPTA
jgi:hypothetical protein